MHRSKALVAIALWSAALLGWGQIAEARKGPDSAKAVDVYVYTSNCKSPNSVKLSYRISADDGKDMFEGPPGGTWIGDGLYRFSLEKEPGHYFLVVTSDAKVNGASDDTCDSQTYFTVLADHTRHLAIVLGSQFTPHPLCSLSGTLPPGVTGATLVIPQGSNLTDTTVGGSVGPASAAIYIPVDIDDGAYYVEHITALSYVLRLQINAVSGNIPIDLTGRWDLKNPYCRGTFVRNITADDVKRAFGPYVGTE